MKYSKSILSLVTILALNSSIMADPNATYVPFSSKAYDNAWIMFGVNGFADGTASAAADGVFTAGYDSVEEASSSDDLASPSPTIIAAAVSGTYFKDSGTSNMATFQALKDATGAAYYTTPVTLALKTSDLTYSETQPVRTMYIAIQTSATDTNTLAKIKLDYKADLEGRTAEIQINNAGTVYSVTISETSTFDNPGIAKYVAPINTAVPLTKPGDTLVYDLAQAPIVPSSYSKATHQGTAAGNERFYNYDAATSVWVIWDRAKITAGANTLTNFEKGKAYWGRVNVNASTANDTNTSALTTAGLYLGKTGLTTADATVYTGKLTSGSWNMIALDPAANRDIRNSATGLSFTTNTLVDADTITILDETGVNTVDINFTTAATYQNAGVNDSGKIAKYINATIEAAKLTGKIPQTFNVKLFGTDATTGLVAISDKKFTIKDKIGDVVAAVRTLANQDPVITSTGLTGIVADALPAGVTSVYGEYALIVEPLVGANTASNIDSTLGGGAGLSAKVQFGNIDGDSLNGGTVAKPLGLAANNTATTLATAAAVLVTDDVFAGTKSSGNVYAIDTDLNSTVDMLMLAATKPFYIKDHTYTRVYTIDSTDAKGTGTATNANVAYTIKNTASATIVPGDSNVTSEFVTAINAVADAGAATLTYAWADNANLVVMTADSSLMDLLDADSAVKDYFTTSSSTADVSKGAVKQIINVSKLARQDLIRNKKTITFTSDATTSATIDINTTVAGVAINPAVTTIAAAISTDADRITFLDSLVNNLNAALKTAGSAAFASHNYITGYNDITKAVITLEGIDIGTTVYDKNTTNPAATVAEVATGPGTFSVSGASIISDLKDNPTYTPDYVNYGPLYTLKDAGYEVKALLRASTKLAATPTTHWDAIDLTRASSDWLKNNEFNLFSVDNSAGYWAYIVSYTNPNAVSVSNVVYTPSFAYHFNPFTNATENIIDTAAFSVAIAGSNAATSNAKLVIAGSEIQLVNTGSTYTANITKYEAGLVAESTNTLSIKVADGLGERYDNLSLTTIDYVKPAVPTVVFTTASLATFSDTSADAANFYFWANYIPDNGASATGPLAIGTTDYNMCTSTSFASSTPYKLVAVDGTGIFGKGNISDAKAFTYVNTEKDATVLTHNFGDSASSAMRYDANCSATAVTTKSGVEIRAQVVGTVKLSYVHQTGSVNVTNDIPVTAYYDIAGSGTAVIQVDSLGTYSGDTFYVQYNNALYTGTFPANRAAADGSFTSPLNLTAVTSEYQLLD